MIGRTEVDYSLLMIDRAKTRLSYQKALVENLRVGAEPRYVDVATNLKTAMERKLHFLLRRHEELLAVNAVAAKI